ncbi:hypothetical protein J4443_02915 [Candidatus Woesearchaeota archaeon]|nr:hypothetical protein [Candidatus Woesearchaeota archaeon]
MNKKYKKFLFTVIFILMLNFVLAQEIGINLIEYHPDSYYTRLQISNNAGKDLNDLTIKIGDSFETSAQGLFKNGANYNAVLNIPPGEYLVTATTKEGVSSNKNVYFSVSKKEVQSTLELKREEIKKEEESRKIAEQNLEAIQKDLEVEREKAIELGLIKKSRFSINIWIAAAIIALVIGIIILSWLIRRRKNE